MSGTPSDVGPKAHKESFVRWQGITITQFGYVVNLILGLALAALGFSFAQVGDKDLARGWGKCLLTSSMFLLLLSVLAGILCVVNRLCDFRKTESIAGDREQWHRDNVGNNEIDKRLLARREETKRLGKRTWQIFRCQLGLFFAGVLVTSLTVAIHLWWPVPKQPVAIDNSAAATARPEPPKPWDANAITAKFDRLEFGEWNLNQVQVEFFYILVNHTDFDYEMPVTSKVMRLLAENNSLEICDESLVQRVLIPAHHNVKVWVMCPIHYSGRFSKKDLGDKKKISEFVTTEFKNTKALLVFDESSRYEINLPSGWQNVHQ